MFLRNMLLLPLLISLFLLKDALLVVHNNLIISYNLFHLNQKRCSFEKSQSWHRYMPYAQIPFLKKTVATKKQILKIQLKNTPE